MVVKALYCKVLAGDRNYGMADRVGATPLYWRGGWANSPPSDSGGTMQALSELRNSTLAHLTDEQELYRLGEEFQSCPSRHIFVVFLGVGGLWYSAEGHSVPV